ncbi:N-acetylneuraminate synthase [Alkalibacillus sp. S2W]|uniref:N-acetylneuraminate synthase n=1 Tax=Alkalibacillus sp. S2W TaxID=3386553 RepID=UPI00398D63F5
MSVYIIAEAGVNHNGSLTTAKQLVDEALKAGADCIKFQTFIASNVASEEAEQADYQKQQAGNTNQLNMLKQLELSFDDFMTLKQYCDQQGIEFLSTGFDFDSLAFLNDLGMRVWKVPSGEITNYPYLVTIAKYGQPIILSTGMATLTEVSEALYVLYEYGASEVTVLHCTSAYPTPDNDVNLNAMTTLSNQFKVPVGYSDHTMGIDIPIAATALGATVIEKHFTISREMEGPDHQASLEPDELSDMIRGVRRVEQALGSFDKHPTSSEVETQQVVRKSIVAKRAIAEGEYLSDSNITVKRPGTGISPMRWNDVIGQQAKRHFEKDEVIEL